MLMSGGYGGFIGAVCSGRQLPTESIRLGSTMVRHSWRKQSIQFVCQNNNSSSTFPCCATPPLPLPAILNNHLHLRLLMHNSLLRETFKNVQQTRYSQSSKMCKGFHLWPLIHMYKKKSKQRLQPLTRTCFVWCLWSFVWCILCGVYVLVC